MKDLFQGILPSFFMVLRHTKMPDAKTSVFFDLQAILQTFFSYLTVVCRIFTIFALAILPADNHAANPNIQS
jgi:hypothetical protein